MRRTTPPSVGIFRPTTSVTSESPNFVLASSHPPAGVFVRVASSALAPFSGLDISRTVADRTRLRVLAHRRFASTSAKARRSRLERRSFRPETRSIDRKPHAREKGHHGNRSLPVKHNDRERRHHRRHFGKSRNPLSPYSLVRERSLALKLQPGAIHEYRRRRSLFHHTETARLAIVIFIGHSLKLSHLRVLFISDSLEYLRRVSIRKLETATLPSICRKERCRCSTCGEQARIYEREDTSFLLSLYEKTLNS